jgi:hypothetical protein
VDAQIYPIHGNDTLLAVVHLLQAFQLNDHRRFISQTQSSRL